MNEGNVEKTKLRAITIYRRRSADEKQLTQKPPSRKSALAKRIGGGGDQRRSRDANDLDCRYSSGGHQPQLNVRNVSRTGRWRGYRRPCDGDRLRYAGPVGSLALG